MNSVRTNNLSLKYRMSTPSGCKDKGKNELVAKTQFFFEKVSLKTWRSIAVLEVSPVSLYFLTSSS